MYNADPYLRCCLSSVCSQTLQEIEIICVDDGSCDESVSILREFEKRDVRVRVATQENAGVSAARNNALNSARGEWVAFVDGDDYLEPGYFQAFADALREAPEADVLQGGMTMVDENGVALGVRGSSRNELATGLQRGTYDSLLSGIWGESCAKMFRASVIREHQLTFNGALKVSEDQEFVCRYLMWCKNVYLVQHAGYCYVQRPGSSIHRFLAGEMAEQVYRETTLYYVNLISGIPRHFARAQKSACARGLVRLCLKSYTWRESSIAKYRSRAWARATWMLLARLPYIMWKAGPRMGCSRRELRRFAGQVLAALRAGI